MTLIFLAASSTAAHLDSLMTPNFETQQWRVGRTMTTHKAGHLHDGAAYVYIWDLRAGAVHCVGEVDIESEVLVG